MGCTQSQYSYNPYEALAPQVPPKLPICTDLVVPSHQNKWGFILQPRMFSMSANDFTILNQLGQPIVMVNGKTFSMRDKQSIRALDGTPIVNMQKKILGLHHTYYIMDGVTNGVIATVRKRITMFKPRFELYLGENYDVKENLLFEMHGDFFSFNYGIYNARNQGMVAKVIANPFQFNYTFGGLAFNQTFFIDIASGVDSVMILALCIIADEVHAEMERERRDRM